MPSPIVTAHHHNDRLLRRAPNAAAWGRALIAVVAAGALLAGCAGDGRPSERDLALHGYWYHDGNHQDGASGQASPQAIYNATHGTWLWPPAENDIPPN
jgi:hypothetical protein